MRHPEIMTENPDEPEILELAPDDQQEDESDILGSQQSIGFDAAISSSDWTTETIISQLRKGNIYLDPDFQRRDAWTIQRKSKYIESLILGIPTPQIILAERKEKRGSYIVIDGKQRLLSLRQFAAKPNDSEFAGFRLKGLEARTDLNNHSYDEIISQLIDSPASEFDNATIRTVVIKSWKNEDFLYEVFLRINSGSVQLSPQELRQALHPGPFTKTLNEFAINSQILKEMLGLKGPDFRMRDNEIVLRFIAFKLFLEDYNGNLKSILDDTTLELNFHWDRYKNTISNLFNDLERSILTTQKIFGKNAFKKWNGYNFETRINRAVFDVISYFFCDPAICDAALNKTDDIVTAFKELCEDRKFSSAISGTTKSHEAVHLRFNLWASALSNILKANLRAPI